jgi:O-methyltransferase
VPSGTPPLVHEALAEAVLSLPVETAGEVVECGAWKGASSAALSLVCRVAGRRLRVCDSFQGLPDEGGGRHVGLHTRVYGHYRAGMFAGSLEEVRDTIARFGAPEVCDFVPGFFAERLAGALGEPVAFAFLDVDLAGSTRDCLAAIWPRLVPDGLIYSDDAGDLEVVRVFFDEAWWQGTLGCAAPGFVGSGCGLPLRPGHCSLGYTRKVTAFDPAAWRRVPFLDYPDAGENTATR